MKKLIQCVLVVAIMLATLYAYGYPRVFRTFTSLPPELYIDIEDPSLSATLRLTTVFTTGDLPPNSPEPDPLLNSTGSLTVDNEGRTYVVIRDKEITCFDTHPYTIAKVVGDRKIKGIECDDDGNMLVSIEKKPRKYEHLSYPYPPGPGYPGAYDPYVSSVEYHQEVVIIEISGFSSLRDELDDIKYVDIAAVQQQIDEIKALLEKLPQLEKNKNK